MKSFVKKYNKHIVAVICAVIIFSTVLAGVVVGYRSSKYDLLSIDSYNLDFSSVIYAADANTGEWHEVDKLYDDENRVWVSNQKIPKHLKDAFVAIEDERFYKHHGVDIKRTTGAVINYIKGFFRKNDSTYGGSTITQQLVKNITDDRDYSPIRKIREMFRALSIERKLSKDEILEMYLNTIYLSRRCNGVQSASNLYFGKDVSELSIAESACIAGITQYPSLYDPISNPDKNKEKQKVVLYKMHELGYINEEEYNNALNEELVFDPSGEAVSHGGSSYFVDALIDEVAEDLQKELGMQKQIAMKMLYTGGLKIYSTMNRDVQDAMEEVYSDPSSFPTYPGEVQPQSSMVILDPYSGEVVGLVGGRGEKEGSRTLNRVTQTFRQPGSTIKPLSVYAPAIELGLITPSSIVFDTKLTLNGWSPQNADRKFRGPIPISQAVASSINTAAVKTIDKLSVDLSYSYLKNNFGLSSLVEKREKSGKVFSDIGYAPLALGGLTDGVSVMNMASAYTAFANTGIVSEPHTYIRVLDSNNNILLNKEPKTVAAISPKTAYTMTNLLRGVVTGGTGTGATLPGMPAAGKTGTTSDDHDRWFIGYTPYYLGAVWFGYDTPATLRSVGYNPSVSIWRNVMSRVHKNLKSRPFRSGIPDDVVHICADSGKRATSLCINAVGGSHVHAVSSSSVEYSTSSTCKTHKAIKICTKTGLLAGSKCPAGCVVTVGALGISDSGKPGYVPSKKCTHDKFKYTIISDESVLEEEDDAENTDVDVVEGTVIDTIPSPGTTPSAVPSHTPQNSATPAPTTGANF